MIKLTIENCSYKKEMYLSDLEFHILNIATKHNRGIVNLLSDKEEINCLFRKGLLTIENELVILKKDIYKMLSENEEENICFEMCIDNNIYNLMR